MKTTGWHHREENVDGIRGTLVVRRLLATDGAIWVRLRAGLHPDCPRGIHALHVARRLWSNEPCTVAFIAEEKGTPVGFIELSLRLAAEGCESGMIAYVEAWYVVPARRECGIGGALLAAGEHWARSSGCRELATHTPVLASQVHLPAAHAALGFTAISRITCWRKALHVTAD